MKTTFIYGLFDPRTLELRYIGKSDDPEDRLKQHISGAEGGVKTHCYDWIRQLLDGSLTPSFEILEEVPRDNWQEYEIAWIKKYKEKGLNLTNATNGGEGTQLFGKANPRYGLYGKDNPTFGQKRTSKQKEKMSKSQKKHWDNNFERRKELSKNNPFKIHTFPGDKNPAKRPEVREKISEAVSGKNNGMYGKRHSVESRKKLSESLLKFNQGLDVHFNKGRIFSEEHKRKIGEARKGRIVSDETRQKLSVINKGKVVSEETREKLRIVNIGKKLSDETKQKISESQKGKVLTEETKNKISEGKKKAPHPYRGKTLSDEHKQKITESLTGKNHSKETKVKMSNSAKKRNQDPEYIRKLSEARKAWWAQRKKNDQ